MLDHITISPDKTLLEAMDKLDKNARQILYVLDGKVLIGALTDGDIRRYLLKEPSLETPIRMIMNSEPKFLFQDQSHKARQTMKEKQIRSIPIINQEMELIKVVFLDAKRRAAPLKNTPVVIMAGGKGTRLYPYTKVLPKPLIPIGETPIIQRIMDRFFDQGYHRFIVSVNYKKDMIKAYFSDESNHYDVSFIEETQPLGTAGSLSLMKEQLKETFFVTNCDVLVQGDYDSMVEKHKTVENLITMVLCKRKIVIPYGVVDFEDNKIIGIEEKPSYTHYTSTGMYIVEPEVIDHVPCNRDVPMTEVLDWALKQNKLGYVVIEEEDWLDMGQLTEMEDMIERLGR